MSRWTTGRSAWITLRIGLRRTCDGMVCCRERLRKIEAGDMKGDGLLTRTRCYVLFFMLLALMWSIAQIHSENVCESCAANPHPKFAGGSPAAGNFLLLAQKKVTKEKGTPLNRPFRGAP